MFRCSAYAIAAAGLLQDYDRVVASLRLQGISRVALAVSMTGKRMSTLEQMREARQRLERDGFGVFALVYGVGHPAMAEFYDAAGRPPSPLPYYEGDGTAEGWGRPGTLLPRGWRYAVNEFGNPVFCCACCDQACVDGNRQSVGEIARIFDEVWYDDDFRMDGDQGAGTAAGSTASCYCDACLGDLASRVGRSVRREDVIRDPRLHDEWIALKTDKMAALWTAVCRAAREVNPQVRMGLMLRWGGEERDGLDMAKLLPAFHGRVLLRAGEGHFGAEEYLRPVSQVVEYLSVAYHVSWFPRDAEVLSETTYFVGMRREDIRKKVALALAAGVSEISYCCCVSGWVKYQDFLAADVPAMARWSAEFGNRAQLHQPIAILRSAAAGSGDCQPVQRVRDRQIFPLLNLAGLCATAVRLAGWRDTGCPAVVAITGRTICDVEPEELAGRHVILDGYALLEESAFSRSRGGRGRRGEGGRVEWNTLGFEQDGLLLTRPGMTVIPYLWQDVPDALLPALLRDIRRVLGPRTQAASVAGDLGVMIAQARHADHDAIMLVNLTHEPRSVTVDRKSDARPFCDESGTPAAPDIQLVPDEVRLFRVPGGTP